MNCTRICEHVPEWIDGRLDAATAGEIREHLEACPACRHECETLRRTLHALDAMPDAEPSRHLRASILSSIEEEKSARRAGPQRPSPSPLFGWRTAFQALAACVLLATGYLAGVHRVPATAGPDADATARQLAELKGRVDSMGQLVSYSLLQQQRSSANDRLEGVLTSATLQQPNENAIDNLVSTLALDPSVNCRLNAVEALYANANNEVVRTAIRVCLPREQSPLVQLAMIDFLAAIRDRDAVSAFQNLSVNSLADPSVRAAAGRALTQL